MNKKTTKRALLFSALSMLLCVSMLVGSTFAWFTDTATTGVNTITAGNLDLVLEYRNADDQWEEVTKDTLLFEEGALYEPGYTEVAYLRVRNNGNLALKYDLNVNVADEVPGINKNGNVFKLSDYIQFGVITSAVGGTVAKYETREAAQKAAAEIGNAKKLQSYTTNDYVALERGEAIEMALVVFMPTTVGNEANHDGINVPSIKMGVTVFATQQVSESDSFDNTYDKNAPTLVVVDGVNYATIDEAFAATGATTFNVSGPIDITKMDMVFSGKTKAAGQTVTFNQIPDAPAAYYDFSGAIDTITANGANITFNGGCIQGNRSNANTGYGIHGTSGTITYNGVTINDTWTSENTATVIYKDCKFTGDAYVYTGSAVAATFESCVFDKADSRAIQVYSHGDYGIDVLIKDCTFKADAKGHTWDGKWTAAVEVNAVYMNTDGATVKIENCSVDGSYNGIVRDKSPESGNAAITVDGKIVSAAALESAIQNAQSGDTVNVGNTTVNVTEVPAGVTIAGSGTDNTTLDLGKGLKIDSANVTIKDTAIDGAFANGPAVKVTGDNTTISNIKLDNTSAFFGIQSTGTANLTVEGSSIHANERAVYVSEPAKTGTLYVKGSTLDALYPINVNVAQCDIQLVVENSTLNGWTSFGKIASASFTNVKFGASTDYGYAFCRPYANATFTNCDFAAGFEVGCGAAGITYTFDNCRLNGVLLTAENIGDLIDETEQTPVIVVR